MSSQLFEPVSPAVVPAPAPAPNPAPPAFKPEFLTGVYAISPYGDVAALNSMYYASGDTAAELARRYGAIARFRASSTMSPVDVRWNTVQLPANSSLLPPAGMRQYDQTKLAALLQLPRFWQWVLQFPNGVEVNAGFLADYFKRNPEDKFPGNADKSVRQILISEGATA